MFTYMVWYVVLLLTFFCLLLTDSTHKTTEVSINLSRHLLFLVVDGITDSIFFTPP